MRMPKVVIVGAGMVGGSAAMLVRVVVPGCEVIMVDVDEPRATGQAIDIAHASALWGAKHIRAGSYDDVRDAAIIVITAGAAMKPGQTRLDLARTNVGILKAILDSVGDKAPNAAYVLATNPVDVLTYLTRQLTGLPTERVISTGTSLDSARLCTLLGERLGVDPMAIQAYVLGEHGDSSMIHWSGATVGDVPLGRFLETTGLQVGPASRDTMKVAVRDAAHLIKQGKGVSHYGIGSAIARICQAILHDSQTILPVGIVHSEVEDVDDVCISLPTLVSAGGAKVLSYPLLTDAEREELADSARVLKEAQDQAAEFL